MFRSIATRSGKAIQSAALLAAMLVVASQVVQAQQPPAATATPAPAAITPAPAAVNTPPAPVIVVVDVQRIMRDSLAAKSIQSQLSSQRNNVQKEFAKRNDDLRTLNQDLVRQQASFSPDQLKQKQRDFEQKVEDFRRDAADREQAFARTQEEAQNKVLQQFITVVQDIARERGANMVLSKQAVVLVAQPFDITEDALKRLDQRIQTVAVAAPRASAPDATSSTTTPPPQTAVVPGNKKR